MTGVDIHLANLTKTYGELGQRITALDTINLHIDAGAVIALTGPSGSGKSTLLHLLGAMDRPSSGEIHVGQWALHELNRKQLTDYRRSIGFIFQAFHLLPALTALDNVTAAVLPRRVDFDKRSRAQHLLAAVGLADREHALPSQLSGGQQQRVAVARALIHDPGLLLADEPTGNLDTTTGAEVLDLLLRLREERSMTVVIATHDPNVAARCDNIIHVRDGKIIGDATGDLGRITTSHRS